MKFHNQAIEITLHAFRDYTAELLKFRVASTKEKKLKSILKAVTIIILVFLFFVVLRYRLYQPIPSFMAMVGIILMIVRLIRSK